MRQVLSNHRRYVAPIRHLSDVPLIPCRFRILVVGKVHSRNSQPHPGQIDTALNHRRARANPRLSIQSSKWTYRSVFRPTSYSHLVNLTTSRRHQEDQILTTRFYQRIIVILSSTRALHLVLATTCRLFEISFHIGLIRAVPRMIDCTPSGRESMLKMFLIPVWLKRLIQDICPYIRRHQRKHRRRS